MSVNIAKPQSTRRSFLKSASVATIALAGAPVLALSLIHI